MSLPSFIKAVPEGAQLSIKLQPRASRTAIAGVLGGELRISVMAPPVDAAANEALVEFLADTLNCARGKIQIVRGKTSRHKTILVSGLAADAVKNALADHLPS